jgi:type VI secretion system secreted protein VgrG
MEAEVEGSKSGLALAAGGAETGSHNGKDYGPFLEKAGFEALSPNGYNPQAGDVAVIQTAEGLPNAGHVEGYDGSQWVSDYKQPNGPYGPSSIYPGSKYTNAAPSYVVYRPTLCPTSKAETNILQSLINWARKFF